MGAEYLKPSSLLDCQNAGFQGQGPVVSSDT